jgi:hypothetical protein
LKCSAFDFRDAVVIRATSIECAKRELATAVEAIGVVTSTAGDVRECLSKMRDQRHLRSEFAHGKFGVGKFVYEDNRAGPMS